MGATLRLKFGKIVGTDPFSTHGTCYVDIKGGAGFSDSADLEAGDFEAAADLTAATTVGEPDGEGWSEGVLGAAGRPYVNKSGRAQLRVYFSTATDNDETTDYIGWYSGENELPGTPPKLVVYYKP